MQPFTTERVFTFQELWFQTCQWAGRRIPYTTFRDWISKVCELDIKDEYTQNEAEWLDEWVRFQSRYPRRSTVKVKRFKEHMRGFQPCQN